MVTDLLLGQQIDLMCYFDQPVNFKLDNISHTNPAFLSKVILKIHLQNCEVLTTDFGSIMKTK